MAASLIARSLSVSRGPVTVLSDVDITLSPGHRVGVIGPNGIGKSTLLRVLAGRRMRDIGESPHGDPEIDGSVTTTPPTAQVGLLEQEPERSATETVDEFLVRRTGVGEAQARLDRALQGFADGTDGADDEYSDALDVWTTLGAADFDARAGQVFAELSLSEALRRQTTKSLSGGEAARVSLASMLLARFDVVLLDEPTNDLDLDALDHLERWLVGLDVPVALVSHDRSFLERTITDVFEIDHHTRRGTLFAGGWTSFLAEREIARLHARQRFDEYDSKRQDLVDRAQREREWASQGAGKVRRSGEGDKFIRNFRMNQTEQLAGKAARTDRALARLEEVEEPRTAWELRYSIPTAGRSGDVVATLNGAIVEVGSFTLGPVDLDIGFGDRIAILGPNGAGKSTLLDVILQRRDPDSGSAMLGASVVVGEIEQARDHLVGDAGLVESFCDVTGLDVAATRTLLAKFRLGAEQLDRPGATLSAGERTRAAMAVLMANGANLLVLDEPTNHLDLDAIGQLEVALEAYTGTVLLVTHDRALLDAVTIGRTLDVDAGIVTEVAAR